MAKEYLLYCDESVEKGTYYSDFYGGALLDSEHLEEIVTKLRATKEELNLHKEVKWTKVTGNYLEKYKSLIDEYFAFVKSGKLKIRIMFRQSAYEAINLTQEQKDNGFFLLYYQFIKHAFGFVHMPDEEIKEPRYLRIFFDELPDNHLRCEEFKSKIFGIQSLNQFIHSRIFIRREDIVDVDSNRHVVLQCMDIILGSMAFRLNNLHKAIPGGETRRGKRTIAKEELYKHILAHIKDIKPRFNIGVSTGGDGVNRWSDPYRHWNFKPKDHKIDDTKFKQ